MTVYKLKDDVLAQKVVDEMVILEPENGEYFTVNGVGTEMISLLDEVVAAMMTRFDVSEADVRQDYQDLIGQLKSQGLIEQAG